MEKSKVEVTVLALEFVEEFLTHYLVSPYLPEKAKFDMWDRVKESLALQAMAILRERKMLGEKYMFTSDYSERLRFFDESQDRVGTEVILTTKVFRRVG